MESSWTRDRTHVPCIGRWTPIHWATGKPLYCLFKPQLWFPDSVEGYVNANTSFEYWKAFHLKHKYSRSVNLPPCCLGSSHILVTTFWKLESKEKLQWDLCKQNWHIWQIFNNTVCDGLHTWMHGSKWKWASCKALGNIKKIPHRVLPRVWQAEIVIPTVLKGEQKWKTLNFTEAILTLEPPNPTLPPLRQSLPLKGSLCQAIVGPSGSDISTALPSISDAKAQERREERRRGEGGQKWRHVLVMSPWGVGKRDCTWGRGWWDAVFAFSSLHSERRQSISLPPGEHRLVSIFLEAECLTPHPSVFCSCQVPASSEAFSRAKHADILPKIEPTTLPPKWIQLLQAFIWGQSGGVGFPRPREVRQDGWASGLSQCIEDRGVVHFMVQVRRVGVACIRVRQGTCSPRCLWNQSLWTLWMLTQDQSSIKYLCALICWCGLLLSLPALMGQAHGQCCWRDSTVLLSETVELQTPCRTTDHSLGNDLPWLSAIDNCHGYLIFAQLLH